ncbi:UDP-Glycosyltransferase superfamily protein [Forsythia ovata]|uniref:UDP-Glycosyltransferase superfamily protein n=1 Tax=Forsythia ovata TaxID=205694 RepID=A0ABD1T811_9LAMI
MEISIALSNSYGVLVNSFYELEPLFVDYLTRESKPKAFSVGPLYLTRPQKIEPVLHYKCRWIQWLDKKLAKRNPVFYVAFGSQAEISSAQLTEIVCGLEELKVIFLWVVRKSGTELGEEFEDMIKEIVDSSTQLPFFLDKIKEKCRRIRTSRTG